MKVGSSSLTTATGGLDAARVAALVDTLAARVEAGGEVVLVSSGAIAAGIAPLGLRSRPRDLATQQAAASVGQGLLMQAYATGFAARRITVGQVLLTVDDVTRRAHYRNAYRTLRRLLDLHALPIVNENDTVATTEIRFGDNDRLAALVAALVEADALILLSDVDALYTGKPSDPASRRIPVVAAGDALAGVDIGGTGSAGIGTGGMVTKLEAARIATGAAIPVVLTSAANAAAALHGEPVARSSSQPRRPRNPACSGSPTRRHRADGCSSTRARCVPCAAGALPCCPPGSPRWTGGSSPGIRSTWSTPTAGRWHGGW